jgi:hypothetical protein
MSGVGVPFSRVVAPQLAGRPLRISQIRLVDPKAGWKWSRLLGKPLVYNDLPRLMQVEEQGHDSSVVHGAVQPPERG